MLPQIQKIPRFFKEKTVRNNVNVGNGKPERRAGDINTTEYKVALTIKEAADYSNIGIDKLESLLRSPRYPFVLYVGKKKLVKRI